MSIYDISITSIDGRETTLGEYRGKVLLVVNVASKCGFTPQYAELEDLYRRFKDRGFAVLGFPCNQFAGQEPGDEAEIAKFCSTNFDVSFPMFSKIDVNGPRTHPLFKFLEKSKKGLLGSISIKWNFTKFLVSAQGEVLARYSPLAKPSSIALDVEQLIEQSAQSEPGSGSASLHPTASSN